MDFLASQITAKSNVCSPWGEPAPDKAVMQNARHVGMTQHHTGHNPGFDAWHLWQVQYQY